MQFDVTSFVLGAMLGSLAAVAIAFPCVGRSMTRLFSVALLALGGGMLIWAIVTLANGHQLNAIACGPVRIERPGEVFGWAGGLLLSGALALGFSFISRADRSDI